jgi:hypothetical protein
MIAFAQTGDFFVTFTNEQNGCCEDDDCGPPDNVPIPTHISINDGNISITLDGLGCTLQGDIDSNGSFEIVIDSHDNTNCNFDDRSECSDAGTEPNQCCDTTGVVIITGTYINGHLEASYLNDENVDEQDPDCTGPGGQDCAETGDFSGGFN